MLQAALFLLGCALSRYLWEIDVTIASVVLGVTSIVIIFYIFIVIAGTASECCPYQTPGARIFRHIFHHVPSFLARLHRFHNFVQNSMCHRTLVDWSSSLKHPWYFTANIPISLLCLLAISIALLTDICIVGLVIVYSLVGLLAACCRTVYRRLIDTLFLQTRSLDKETLALDLRCVSWMLQTSLDKAVHLSTLKHLVTMKSLAGFDPTLVVDCFSVFVGCVRVSFYKHDVAVVEGFQQLATVSALSFFNTTSHLLAMDPTSSILEDVRQRYLKVFSTQATFHGHQFYHIINAVRSVFVPRTGHQSFQWSGYKPSTCEHTIVAHNLTKVARFKSHQKAKVPRWILRFVFHSLSLDPLPTASIVADCLLIVAIDLDCDLRNTRTTVSDERCVCVR